MAAVYNCAVFKLYQTTLQLFLRKNLRGIPSKRYARYFLYFKMAARSNWSPCSSFHSRGLLHSPIFYSILASATCALFYDRRTRKNPRAFEKWKLMKCLGREKKCRVFKKYTCNEQFLVFCLYELSCTYGYLHSLVLQSFSFCAAKHPHPGEVVLMKPGCLSLHVSVLQRLLQVDCKACGLQSQSFF